MVVELKNYPGMGKHVPEDKDQALVETPYGKGRVRRTTTHQTNSNAIMREIELTDWVKPGSGPQRPSLLYSPTKFPSVQPQVGSEVATIYGRGKVVELREEQDAVAVIVVRLSSWRLAGRSRVTCYFAADGDAVQVVRPHKVYEMSVAEKIEHAQDLKKQANDKFAAKDYEKALTLYATAVDAVRYVQHKKESSNDLRADLLVVMITCCNNAATCCLQLQAWDRAQKFGKNALVLLEALFEKKGNNIHKILNRAGIGDSKLFGAWKVKSYLVIARGLAETHENEEAVENLKLALEAVVAYKTEGDSMFKQLQVQDKEIRKLFTVCKERVKAERKKEKQRARAMFGGGSEEKKDSDKKEHSAEPETVSTNNDQNEKSVSVEAPTDELDETEDARAGQRIPMKKRVSFADGSAPGNVDDDAEPSFFEEHKEAVLLVAGVVLGSALVHMLFKKQR
jgi:tetratricopeptide (TPR) repeat protein